MLSVNEEISIYYLLLRHRILAIINFLHTVMLSRTEMLQFMIYSKSEGWGLFLVSKTHIEKMFVVTYQNK